MLGLARLAMKSPAHSSILAALLTVLPFGVFFSSPLVALATLKHGYSAGAQILGAAFIGGIVSFLVFGIPMQLLILPLVALVAMVLRGSNSWSFTLVGITFVGLVLVVILELLLGGLFDWIAEEWRSAASQLDEQTAAGLMAWVEARPNYKYLFAAGLVQSAVMFVLWARYWQAALFNPGGLGEEIRSLRMSKAEILALVLGALIGSFLFNPLVIALFGFPFIFAGMALMHGVVAKTKLGGQWLFALYIALFLPVTNQILVPLLVLLVLVDPFVDIRSRIQERPGPDNE